MIDTFGCIKNTIKVAAGHYVDLLDPSPDSIDINSIASALSKICRFGGHCPRFYTVAEHSVHAVNLAASSDLSLNALRAIFLHDAAEAYCGDVVKPLKVMLPEYSAVEARIESAISIKFCVDFKGFREQIRKYDRLMLKAEKIRMWPEDREKWFGFDGIDQADVLFGFWGPEEAQSRFLYTANCLGLMI